MLAGTELPPGPAQPEQEGPPATLGRGFLEVKQKGVSVVRAAGPAGLWLPGWGTQPRSRICLSSCRERPPSGHAGIPDPCKQDCLTPSQRGALSARTEGPRAGRADLPSLLSTANSRLPLACPSPSHPAAGTVVVGAGEASGWIGIPQETSSP